MCRPTPQNSKIYLKMIFGFAEVAKHIYMLGYFSKSKYHICACVCESLALTGQKDVGDKVTTWQLVISAES